MEVHLYIELIEKIDNSTLSVAHDQICTGTDFAGTLKEAVDICYSPGQDLCEGILDKNCDGQIIRLCTTKPKPAKSSNSTLYGCSYIKKGMAIMYINFMN